MLLQSETVAEFLGENGCIEFNFGPTLRNTCNRSTTLYSIIILASFANLIKYAAIASRALLVLHEFSHNLVSFYSYFLEVVVLNAALYFFLALERRHLAVLELRHAQFRAL